MDNIDESKMANQRAQYDRQALILASIATGLFLSDSIAGAEGSLYRLTAATKEALIQQDLAEAALRQVVNDATIGETPAGKPRYTNETQRSAALLALKQNDSNWIASSLAVKNAEIAQLQQRIKIDQLHREFRLSCLAVESYSLGRRHESQS